VIISARIHGLHVVLQSHEMHPHADGKVVQDGSQEGPDRDGGIGDVGNFRHDKCAGTHDGRHQKTAGGSGGLHRTGELGTVAEFLHQRDGEGAGCVHIGCRHAGDGSEEAGTDHRYLGRSTRGRAGHAAGKVGKELAGLGILHEGSEDDEHGNKGRSNAGDGSVDSGIGYQVVHLYEPGKVMRLE
jgi:hypothetical protein